MLKKLAKYGNSTTLVIDKAILELLNMNESSVVKLTTNGNSLTITPVTSIDEDEKVSYDTYEALVAAKQSFERKLERKTAHKELDKELQIKAKQDFHRVFKKHAEVFIRFNTQIMPGQEYQDALKGILEKIDPANEPEAFYQEINKLKVKLCPESVDLDKDIKAVGKKYSQLA